MQTTRTIPARHGERGGIRPGDARWPTSPLALLYVVGSAVALTVVFGATKTLGLSAVAATGLYWALNALSWAAMAASVVASFGIAAALGGMVFGLAKKWALKTFVAW